MAKRAYPTKYVALDRCIDDLLADRKCREELPPGPDRLEVRELMETAQRLRTFFRASLWPEPAKGDQSRVASTISEPQSFKPNDAA